MENPVMKTQVKQQEEAYDPLVRVVYAVGAAMVVLGTLVPGRHGWAAAGIALLAFCWMYE